VVSGFFIGIAQHLQHVFILQDGMDAFARERIGIGGQCNVFFQR
jgi:hypothetical protein